MQAIVTAEPVVLDFEMMRFIKLQNNISLFWCFNGLNFLMSNERETENLIYFAEQHLNVHACG